jgi:holliday junction DNA helicase RuvB
MGCLMNERVVSGKTKEEDFGIENSLRPRTLNEYIGQERVKENLRISIEAAKARGDALDHVLLSGPPGLGKTTLANIIANELEVDIRITTGPTIDRVGDLGSILSSLQSHQVLFIDEVHRLNHIVEEKLYPAMEDFMLDIIIGEGPAARIINLPLQPFTMIGATTRIALLTGPLRDRFGLPFRLDFYTVKDIQRIINRSARILEVEIDTHSAHEIALRSRGTPRVANRLLKRVRDYAQVRANGQISPEVAQESLKLLEIDDLGLDEGDRRVLKTIIEKFDGGPVGLETIAAASGEESDTIMDVYEPYLLQLGFIQRTPRGRSATRLAYEHLGLKYGKDKNYDEAEQPGLL